MREQRLTARICLRGWKVACAGFCTTRSLILRLRSDRACWLAVSGLIRKNGLGSRWRRAKQKRTLTFCHPCLRQLRWREGNDRIGERAFFRPLFLFVLSYLGKRS